jgi:hypothetical protein
MDRKQHPLTPISENTPEFTDYWVVPFKCQDSDVDIALFAKKFGELDYILVNPITKNATPKIMRHELEAALAFVGLKLEKI